MYTHTPNSNGRPAARREGTGQLPQFSLRTRAGPDVRGQCDEGHSQLKVTHTSVFQQQILNRIQSSRG
jgi:hypothetical protein